MGHQRGQRGGVSVLPSDIESIERATLAAVAPERVEALPGWLLPMDHGTVGRAHAAVALEMATRPGRHLLLSGGELTVPQGKSILEVLTAHNVSVNSSCLQGVCGYCEVAVLQGEVDHRDAILTPSERASNSTMMVCCSGAKSARLVLDL